MRNRGFAQILLIVGILALVIGLIFYIYQSGFTKPAPVPPTPKIETVDQTISSLDSNFNELSAFEKDLDLKDLVELEKDLNATDLSQI